MVYGKLEPHLLSFRMKGYGALLTKHYGVCPILHYRDMAPFFRYALFPEGVTADTKWRFASRFQNKQQVSLPYSTFSVEVSVCVWDLSLLLKRL
jgi:hypothetical protein